MLREGAAQRWLVLQPMTRLRAPEEHADENPSGVPWRNGRKDVVRRRENRQAEVQSKYDDWRSAGQDDVEG